MSLKTQISKRRCRQKCPGLQQNDPVFFFTEYLLATPSFNVAGRRNYFLGRIGTNAVACTCLGETRLMPALPTRCLYAFPKQYSSQGASGNDQRQGAKVYAPLPERSFIAKFRLECTIGGATVSPSGIPGYSNTAIASPLPGFATTGYSYP